MVIDCHKCEHYYVTWEEQTPHGCRAMGFKSRRLPSMVVRKSTPDMDCLSFKKKEFSRKVQQDKKG
jgi:hypothetical protein